MNTLIIILIALVGIGTLFFIKNKKKAQNTGQPAQPPTPPDVTPSADY